MTKCANIASNSRDMCNVLQHCLTLFTQQEEVGRPVGRLVGRPVEAGRLVGRPVGR